MILKIRNHDPLTEEYLKYIREYTTNILGLDKTDRKTWTLGFLNTKDKVLNMISSYGRDGFDNKPKDMNAAVYWLQHLDIKG